MKIYYITGNKRKIDRARLICARTGIEIEQIELETPEIQGNNSEEIAAYSAQFAGEKLKKPLIKLDVSFHINALNGFPGPFVKYINQWLKPKDVLKMMEGIKNRSCYWTDALAFYQAGKPVKVFSSQEQGEISIKARGKNGWGMDKIFIPEGQNKTKAELSDSERINICNRGHWDQFIGYIEKIIS